MWYISSANKREDSLCVYECLDEWVSKSVSVTDSLGQIISRESFGRRSALPRCPLCTERDQTTFYSAPSHCSHLKQWWMFLPLTTSPFSFYPSLFLSFIFPFSSSCTVLTQHSPHLPPRPSVLFVWHRSNAQTCIVPRSNSPFCFLAERREWSGRSKLFLQALSWTDQSQDSPLFSLCWLVCSQCCSGDTAAGSGPECRNISSVAEIAGKDNENRQKSQAGERGRTDVY